MHGRLSSIGHDLEYYRQASAHEETKVQNGSIHHRKDEGDASPCEGSVCVIKAFSVMKTGMFGNYCNNNVKQKSNYYR